MPRMICLFLLLFGFFLKDAQAQGSSDHIVMEVGTASVNTVSETADGRGRRFEGNSRPIDPLQIARMLKNIKAVFCGAIEKGQVRVWFKATAGADLLIVSANAEGGIETTIKCD